MRSHVEFALLEVVKYDGARFGPDGDFLRLQGTRDVGKTADRREEIAQRFAGLWTASLLQRVEVNAVQQHFHGFTQHLHNLRRETGFSKFCFGFYVFKIRFGSRPKHFAFTAFRCRIKCFPALIKYIKLSRYHQ